MNPLLFLLLGATTAAETATNICKNALKIPPLSIVLVALDPRPCIHLALAALEPEEEARGGTSQE